jgi:hypothetical protein
MNKNELLRILQTDIEELKLLVESMQQIQDVPDIMKDLAIRKTEYVLDELKKLKNSTEEHTDFNDNSEQKIIASNTNNDLPPTPDSNDSIEEIAIEETKDEIVAEFTVSTIIENSTPEEEPASVNFSSQTEDISVTTIEENTENKLESTNQKELIGTIIANEKIVTEKKITNEIFSSQSTKRVGNKFFGQSLKKAINLNDRYRYQRELFGGNVDLMNKIIDILDGMNSLDEAKEYVKKEFDWDEQSETVNDFYSLLESRF